MKNYYKNLHNFKRNVRKFQEGGTTPAPAEDVSNIPAGMGNSEPTTAQDPMQALKDAMQKAIESNGEDCQAAFEVVNLLQEMMENQQNDQKQSTEQPVGAAPAARRGMKQPRRAGGSRMYGYYQEGDEFEEPENSYDRYEEDEEDEEDSTYEFTREEAEQLLEQIEGMSPEDAMDMIEGNADYFIMDNKGNPAILVEGYENPITVLEKKAYTGMKMAGSNSFMERMLKRK